MDSYRYFGETFRGLGTPDPVQARVFALDAEFRVALDWTREHAPELHTRVAAALGFILFDSGRARDAYAELGLAIERAGVIGATGGWAAVIRAFAAGALVSPAEAAPLMETGRSAALSRRCGPVPAREQSRATAGDAFRDHVEDPGTERRRHRPPVSPSPWSP